MKLESYESLREQNAYEALWLELLNASGFAGVLSDGKIVDRRYHPEAVPVQENSVFGVAKTKNPKSLGECRVRTESNLSEVDNVNFIKEKSAELIDVCDDLKPKGDEKVFPEKLRLIALAQTAYEEGAMWGEKAATFGL